MFLPLQQLNDALASLERILTTPIPFSYAAHIWEVTWIYVLILPFQLYNAGFGWITVRRCSARDVLIKGSGDHGDRLHLDWLCLVSDCRGNADDRIGEGELASEYADHRNR